MSWHSLIAALLFGFLGGVDASSGIIRGVNIGGWLVTEPWMTPSLYSSTNTTDEWHLTNVLGKEEALSTLEEHWSTFYTRDDFVDIKNAGLRRVWRVLCCATTNLFTSVRIPIGYWAIDLLDYEPYVQGQYPYLLQAVQWAKELGLTVLVDLHGVPGSQNGWEESGLIGPIDFTANTTNTERSLNVLKNLTTEFMQSQYSGVVTNIELMNEPIFADALLKAFYTLGADVVGAANSSGINITIHDAFYDPPSWENYNPWDADATSPAEFLTLDTHQFWGFGGEIDLAEEEVLEAICSYAATVKMAGVGILPTIVGEWSLDSGVTANSTTDSATDVAKRTWFRTLFEAQNAAYAPNAAGQPPIGWYYWAWHTEYDIDAWSYSKGLAQGYIPSNVSDPSTYVFPILENGCINSTYPYTAPATVTTATATGTGSSTTASNTASTTASSSSSEKTGAASSMQISLILPVGSVLLFAATL